MGSCSPFGLQHKGYNGATSSIGNSTAQKFGYNGKEFEESLGLNWLEYGARSFDPSLGRFMNIDRFAEKYESITPYQYTFNNPIRFIDVNGDYIYIYEGGEKKYRYENGQTQHKVDGKWTAIDKSVTLSDFARDAIAELQNLEGSGKTGKGLVEYFSGDKHNISIRESKGEVNLEWNEIVFINLDYNRELPTTEGMLKTKSYLTLGHEMAHRVDKNNDFDAAMKIWYGKGKKATPVSEIYATHIENMIRSESGIPLRTHYGISHGYSDKKGHTMWGDEQSRVLDSNGNSLFYDSKGKKIPSIMNGVNGGEIVKDRYNYKKSNPKSN